MTHNETNTSCPQNRCGEWSKCNNGECEGIHDCTCETPIESWEGQDMTTTPTDYNHLSHTHCWTSKEPPCGIPLEKHTQCCLCDLTTPIESWEKEFDETFILGDYNAGTTAKYNNIKSFIRTKLDEAYFRGKLDGMDRAIELIRENGHAGEVKANYDVRIDPV